MQPTPVNESAHACIYPGQFQPRRLVKEDLKKVLVGKTSFPVPQVSVAEFADHFMIAMELPGFQREDFFVSANARQLTILAIAANDGTGTAAALSPGFEPPCARQQLELPGNVDPSFARAEYRCGVLQISMFKTETPYTGRSRIVVY